MKTLIFEGAGWAGADSSTDTDVTNCRIRTRLRNNKGRVIYLEMGCSHFDPKNKLIPEYAIGFNYVSHIDHLFYADSKWDARRNRSRSLSPLTEVYFEYNKANILDFVNNRLDCSFDNVEVINEGLSIHAITEPLCDCSNGDYEPYADIVLNIDTLDGIKPVSTIDRINLANFRISYNSIMQIDYIKKYIDDKTETEQKNYKNLDYVAELRWNDDGTITELVITADGFCHMGLGSEDLRKVIDMIKADNRKEITA